MCLKTGDIDNISGLLTRIIKDASKIYTDLISAPKNKSFFSRFLYDQSPKADGLTKILKSSNTLPLKDVINDVRNLKSDAEIANMRKAGQASGRAYTDAMRQAWTKEKDLAAYLDYQFRSRGCDCSAYIPVVAGGQVGFVLPWFTIMTLTASERKYHSLHSERPSPEVSFQYPIFHCRR